MDGLFQDGLIKKDGRIDAWMEKLMQGWPYLYKCEWVGVSVNMG